MVVVECPHHPLEPPRTTVRVMPSWSATRWQVATPTWASRVSVAALSEERIIRLASAFWFEVSP